MSDLLNWIADHREFAIAFVFAVMGGGLGGLVAWACYHHAIRRAARATVAGMTATMRGPGMHVRPYGTARTPYVRSEHHHAKPRPAAIEAAPTRPAITTPTTRTAA